MRWRRCLRRTPPSRYYLMDAGPPAATAPAGDTVVFVDRATVAASCRPLGHGRPPGHDRGRLRRQDAWAEPIAAQVTSVVTDALGDRFGRANVVPTPVRLDREPDFRVVVEVLRFETGADGTALLDARWTLLEGRTTSLATAGRERLDRHTHRPRPSDARAAAPAATPVDLGRGGQDAIEGRS
ncbi:MAG: ABC-type transport auxiliary lipoprotein family protein [Geminicoccaceae bacterium]